MQHWRLASIIIVCASLSASLHAQWRDMRLSFLGTEEGLHSAVRDMTQDSTGYLYFATSTGMYRYDGHIFEFFGHDPKNPNSLGSTEVHQILAASDGLIWMTLRYGAINSFNPKNGEFRKYALPELPSKKQQESHALYEDDDGTLWIGASDFRLLAFDRSAETFREYIPEWVRTAESHPARLNILSILPDALDSALLWLNILAYAPPGAPHPSYGICRFNKTTGTFQSHACNGNIKYIDEQGHLWGTLWANAITRYDPATRQCDTYYFEFQFGDELARPISQDIQLYQDRMLITSTVALLEFNKSLLTFEPVFHTNSWDQRLTTLFTDRDHNLWVGTWQGAYIVDPDEQHIRYFSLDQFGHKARIYPGRLAYSESLDVVWLATQADDRVSKQIYRIPVQHSERANASTVQTSFWVNGLATDHRGRIWVAGDGDFHLLNPVSNTLSRTSLMAGEMTELPGIWNLNTTADGWIGAIGRDEFVWFHTDTMAVRRVWLKDFPKSPLANPADYYFDGFSFARDHTAYVFTNEIFSVDLMTGDVFPLRYSGEINPNFDHVQDVIQDSEGHLWVSFVDLLGRFSHHGDSLILRDVFTVSDGLLSPSALELHIDHAGRVWVFTVNGMHCIDPQTREVKYFGTKSGLTDSFIDPRQVISISDGRIATVNSNGLIVFDAEALWQSIAMSDQPVVISRVRIEGKDISTGRAANYLERIMLQPGNALADISFQALAYPSDYLVEYSYRILGLHDDWISIGQNKFVTLPTLRPGEYTFEVKAGHPHSTAPVKSLEIFMSTPVYQRPWFLLLAALGIACAIFFVYRWRIAYIRREEEQKTDINKKMAELELKALRSQMNPHFMFNSLNSIKNYILHAEPRLAAEYLSNFAHLIRMILQNSREKSISLQEELDTLVLYIELERLRFDNEFDFSCIVDHGVRLDAVRIPPMLLQPYVENAIWHGLMHKKEASHLLLQFSKCGDMIACIIDDDGVGRDTARKMKSLSATRYKSMGMGITQDRIELINKMDALGITSVITDKQDAEGKPAGTRVVLHIPASVDVYS